MIWSWIGLKNLRQRKNKLDRGTLVYRILMKYLTSPVPLGLLAITLAACAAASNRPQQKKTHYRNEVQFTDAQDGLYDQYNEICRKSTETNDWNSFSLSAAFDDQMAIDEDQNMNQYSRSVPKCIGLGTDGMVWLVVDTKNGVEKKVAIKKVSISAISNKVNDDCLYKELLAMTTMTGHPFFPAFYTAYIDGDDFCVEMEFLEGNRLLDVIRAFYCLDDRFVKHIGRQVLQAIDFMGSRGWVHCDLSTRNIIIMPSGDAKVIDFGRAVPDGSPTNISQHAPLITWAPEVRDGVMTSKSDVWSWGVVIFHASLGVIPFSDMNSERMHDDFEEMDEELQKVVLLALTRNVRDRPTARDLLSHPFFIPDEFDDFTEYFKLIRAFLGKDVKVVPQMGIDAKFAEIEQEKAYADPMFVLNIKRELFKITMSL